MISSMEASSSTVLITKSLSGFRKLNKTLVEAGGWGSSPSNSARNIMLPNTVLKKFIDGLSNHALCGMDDASDKRPEPKDRQQRGRDALLLVSNRVG